jgi:hypothetical protein
LVWAVLDLYITGVDPVGVVGQAAGIDWSS